MEVGKRGQYIILSEITSKPYIDEKRNAYLFLYEKDAMKFVEDNWNVLKLDLSSYSFPEICSYVYASGAMYLIIKGEEAEEEIRLHRDKLKKRYYNSNLNANIARYLHTRDKRYIRAFSDSYFIVPINIKNHPNANIKYATAKRGDSPHVFVAFTDLEEYEKWAEKVKGWKPLEVDASGLKRIGRHHGFIINPFGKNMILTKKMLEMIPTKDDEEGDYR